MPRYVIERLSQALDAATGRGLNGSRILVLGAAYKKNVDDTRESPALKLMDLLELRGAACDYHDPHVPEMPPTREHPRLTGRRSVDLDRETLAGYDAILVATDHDAVDYALVVEAARLVVDTRNACRSRGVEGANVVRA